MQADFTQSNFQTTKKKFPQSLLSKLPFKFPGRNNYDKNKMFKILAIFLVLIIIGFLYLAFKPSKKENQTVTNKVEIEGPLAVKTLNKEFKFPLVDSKGKELTKISYRIEGAELRRQIIVAGKSYTAIKGKLLLVLTLKITNDYSRPIDINARDYIRVSVKNSPELMAADYHNDPVTIQPISTKSTRIGFPINETDKNLVLTIGEIKSDKQKLDLNF